MSDGSFESVEIEDIKKPSSLLQRSIWGTLLVSVVPAVTIFVFMEVGGSTSLSREAQSALEQTAGGALLVTYMAELWYPETLIVLTHSVTDQGRRFERVPDVWRVASAMLGLSAGVLLQDSFSSPFEFGRSQDCSVGRHDGETWGEFVPFLIGYVSDGLVIAYTTSTKHIVGICSVTDKGWVPPVGSFVLSIALSIDNVIDGFGLAGLAERITGSSILLVAFVCFACTLIGCTAGYLIRYFLPSSADSRTLKWQACFDIFVKYAVFSSILVGGLSLIPTGMTPAVLVGVLLVWVLLQVGEWLESMPKVLHCGCRQPIKLYEDE